MNLINQNDQIGLWAVNANGKAERLSKGTKLDVMNVRAIVSASSPDDALNQANAQAFKVGVRNATADEPAEIVIYGEIGDPWQASDASSMAQFLRQNKGYPVNVRINSPGGLAYDGITIHNALKAHDAPVTTIVEGFAGSAATIIAVGGQPAKIYENASFFIHRAALVAIGNRDVMEEAMTWLDQVDEAIARTYKAKTGKAYDKIMEMMRGSGKRDGTNFTAKEAVAEKFCNEVITLKKPASNVDTREVSSQSPQFVEAARAMRMRANAAFFKPAESTVVPVAAKPTQRIVSVEFVDEDGVVRTIRNEV